MSCPSCGSPRVVAVEGDYYTGVEADGYRERRQFVGVKCLDCGMVEEV